MEKELESLKIATVTAKAITNRIFFFRTFFTTLKHLK